MVREPKDARESIPAIAPLLRRTPNELAVERTPTNPDGARPADEAPPPAPRIVVKPPLEPDGVPSVAEERSDENPDDRVAGTADPADVDGPNEELPLADLPSVPEERSDENPEDLVIGAGGAAVPADVDEPNEELPRRSPENPCGVLALDGALSRVPRYRNTVVPPLLVKPRLAGALPLKPRELPKLELLRGAEKLRELPPLEPENDPELRAGNDCDRPKLPLDRGAENVRGADENDDDRGAEKLRAPPDDDPPKLRDAPPPPANPPPRPPPKFVTLEFPPPDDFWARAEVATADAATKTKPTTKSLGIERGWPVLMADLVRLGPGGGDHRSDSGIVRFLEHHPPQRPISLSQARLVEQPFDPFRAATFGLDRPLRKLIGFRTRSLGVASTLRIGRLARYPWNLIRTMPAKGSGRAVTPTVPSDLLLGRRFEIRKSSRRGTLRREGIQNEIKRVAARSKRRSVVRHANAPRSKASDHRRDASCRAPRKRRAGAGAR